jgi:hemerythrin-like domain-containing protein
MRLIYRKLGCQAPDKMTSSNMETQMNTDLKTDRFKALDACHQQIHDQLAVLAELLERWEAGDDVEMSREKVKNAEAFFSSTARAHHAEEERNVFPILLRSDDSELVHAVQTLKQDHGWIEQNWLELSPMLRAVAQGEDWVDMAELKHTVQVFLTLCHDHIVLEESLIYPQAKAQWAQEAVSRAMRLAQK